jgi:hypothetical protein
MQQTQKKNNAKNILAQSREREKTAANNISVQNNTRKNTRA